jgi:hypothetical protein
MGNRHLSPLIRFWSHVNKSENPDGCWFWTGVKTSAGYGILSINYKNTFAHRFSYEIHGGTIPEHMLVCHHCDHPACINPSHLFLGTHSDNTQDMIMKNRQGSRFGKFEHKAGEQHPRAKLTWEQIEEIRKLRTSGIKLKEIANKFDVSITNIYDIVKLHTWKSFNSSQEISYNFARED